MLRKLGFSGYARRCADEIRDCMRFVWFKVRQMKKANNLYLQTKSILPTDFNSNSTLAMLHGYCVISVIFNPCNYLSIYFHLFCGFRFFQNYRKPIFPCFLKDFFDKIFICRIKQIIRKEFFIFLIFRAGIYRTV